MNVLKKNIFAKPGTKAKNRDVVSTGKFFKGTMLPLLQLNNVEGLSQQSMPSRETSKYEVAISPEPPAAHSNFKDVVQSFIEQCQDNSPNLVNKDLTRHEDNLTVTSNDLSHASGEAEKTNKNHSDTADEVLRVLGRSTSFSDASKHSFSNLTFRAPPHQDDDMYSEDNPTYTPAFMQSRAVVGMTPLSSIRANTTHTSSDKKTPRQQRNKSFKTPKTNSTVAGGPSDSDISYCVIAVTEGRGHASGEVGIAAMDPRRPHLVLCQISDSQSYTNSLAKMNVFNFTEAIVPNTFVDGPVPRKLYVDLLERFPTVTVNHVQRRHFSESTGLQMIHQYCSKESESVMVVVKDKFYALAAAAALLKYIEFTQNVVIARQSLKVEYQGTDGTTLIDLDTANRLELVLGLVSREEMHSLLGVLKHCRTRGGLRLLRANLLQPPADTLKINTRLDCVTELLENPILFNTLQSVISQMKNAENLLSLCMVPPQQSGLKAAQFNLRYTLLLKNTLELVPALVAALEEATCDYFTNVRENLGDVRLSSMLTRVLQTIMEGAPVGRTGNVSQLHACFMIRTGINGLLDVAKKTYCEIAQDISELVNTLKQKLNLPLRLSYSTSKGYHIQLSVGDRDAAELPPELILVQKSRGTITCYTTELVALDQRCQQALQEIEIMTNVLLFELLNDIREEIACLFPLCESLAELDVCAAFAHVAAGESYVRPTFGDDLMLVEARHPILDANARERVVANDVFADNAHNFIILTGPNQSGKSIYIRQVALLQVMAQVGCYVPAKKASFRIADRIFSRIGFDDSIENNASTLMVEMQDMEFIRSNLTSNSLVIVDELCRGTSVDEGTCLAFVLCEELLDSSAFTFFTTHFFFLTKLEKMYCNVRNFHFETQMAADGSATLRFTHRMLEGVTPTEQYGIRLATLMGFPASILNVATTAAEKLMLERKPQPDVCGLSARYEISKNLRMNLPQGNANWNEVLPVIRLFKAQYENLPPEGMDLSALLNTQASQSKSPKLHIDRSPSSHYVANPVVQMNEIDDEKHQLLESCNPLEDEMGDQKQSDEVKISSRWEDRIEAASISGCDIAHECENMVMANVLEQCNAEKASLNESDNTSNLVRIADPNGSFERTQEAALLLLNLGTSLPTAHQEAYTNTQNLSVRRVKSEGECQDKMNMRRKINRSEIQKGKKKPKRNSTEWEEKQGMNNLLREMNAYLPHAADKTHYYEWKFSRNLSTVETVAFARRCPTMSPSIAVPTITAEGTASSLPAEIKSGDSTLTPSHLTMGSRKDSVAAMEGGSNSANSEDSRAQKFKPPLKSLMHNLS